MTALAEEKLDKTEPEKADKTEKAPKPLGDRVQYYLPEELTLVQLDSKHALYNPKDRSIKEPTVKNIMVNGVLENVGIRKVGDTIEVIYGTNRVLHVAEANKRLGAAGGELIRVPCVLKRGDDAHAFGLMVSENEFRSQTSPLSRARLVQRLLDMGRSEDDVCVQFGLSGQTLRNYAALLECCAAVQKAVESGSLPASVARELSKLPRDEQEAALAKLLAGGTVKGESGKKAARAVASGKDPAEANSKRMMSRRFLEKWYDELVEIQNKPAATAVAAALHFILGHPRALGDISVLNDTAKTILDSMVKKPKVKKEKKPRKEKVAKAPKEKKPRKKKKASAE
jgi:ParB family chromosome partitioning protein